jgi:cell division protein FtsA
MQLGKNKLINRSAVVYELDDCRRLANPIGAYSEILKGKLTFVVAKSYFIDVISSAINQNGVLNIEWISTTMAQAMYLLDDETRDRLAVVCDVGYISTTVSIIHGDGILYQDSFSYGGGYVTAMLTERFNLSFEIAEKLKRKANLCAINQLGNYDVIEDDDGKFYNGEQINECILSSLDELCEKISNSLDASGYVIPEYVTLMITGGGITYLRGAKEHVANRLGMSVEVLSPKVPMMDKPTESSVLSLLDLALGQN